MTEKHRRTFKKTDQPREGLTGGIYDVPGYPCVQCKYLQDCNSINCPAFQTFWRRFMRRVRENLGIKQPEAGDCEKLMGMEDES